MKGEIKDRYVSERTMWILIGFALVFLVALILLVVPLIGLFAHWLITDLFNKAVDESIYWTAIGVLEVVNLIAIFLYLWVGYDDS